MGDIVHTLENRRYLEPTIAYAESHDQVRGKDDTSGTAWTFVLRLLRMRMQSETSCFISVSSLLL